MRGFSWIVGWFLLCSVWAQGIPEDYTLDVGDVLSVVVLRHPEFSNEYTVPPNGRVIFHGVGEVEVRGRTLAEVAEAIRQRLATRLRNPEVSVSLKQARPFLVFVEGQVGKPGAYPIQPGWRVFEAIAAAEGLKTLPERVEALLIRGDQVYRLDLSALYHRGDPSVNLPVQHGDKISIQLKPTIRIAVVGEVNRPGTYDIEAGATVLQAIAIAGGTTTNASLQKAFIDRKGRVIPADLYRLIIAGETAGSPLLEDGDAVIVPTNLTRVAVVGQVTRPGYYPVPEGKPFTLSDAIAIAGGPTSRAITSRVYILRVQDGIVQRIAVPYQRFLRRGDLNGNPLVLNGDVVFVPETRRVELGYLLTLVSLVNIVERLGWFK